MSGWLAQLGGAQEPVLRRAPGERAKFVSLGAVLVGTAVVAAASAMFALDDAVGLPLAVSAVVGLVWGLIIFNLDRMLVVSMVRQNGWKLNLLSALPRLLLAVLLGAVISMPLVLRIFQPEINSELEVMRNEAVGAAQTQIDDNDRYKRIPGLEADVARLTPLADGDVSKDPDVIRLTPLLAAKDTELREAELQLQCERDGRADCGSGVPGDGPRSEEKAARVQRLQNEDNDLRQQLDTAVTAARTRISSGSDPATEAARSDLAQARSDLQTIRQEKSDAEQSLTRAEQGNRGLSARLEALFRLGDSNPALGLAHLSLFLLFAAIEILPVLSKLLTGMGPPSLYEQIAAGRETEALDTDTTDALRERKLAAVREEFAVQLERDRAEAQAEAARRTNTLLAQTQERIATQAIETWSKVATARSDVELARWYRRHAPAPRTEPVRREPAPDADGHYRPAEPAEPAEQAMTYAEFVASQQTGRRDPMVSVPSDNHQPGIPESRFPEQAP